MQGVEDGFVPPESPLMLANDLPILPAFQPGGIGPDLQRRAPYGLRVAPVETSGAHKGSPPPPRDRRTCGGGKAIFSFLRRIAHVHDISPVLVGEIAVYDALHDTEEMGSRFDTVAVSRWGFDEDFATLLDSLEASMPLAHASNLSRPPLAKMIHDLSEGLIGEVVDIVTRTAVAAVESGEERITSSTVMALGYVPLSRRRNSALRHSMT